MQKPKLGPHAFRKRVTCDEPHPCDQLCLVTGLNLDGTVGLVAFEPNGEQYAYQATLIQEAGDVACHYEPCIITDPSKLHPSCAEEPF